MMWNLSYNSGDIGRFNTRSSELENFEMDSDKENFASPMKLGEETSIYDAQSPMSLQSSPPRTPLYYRRPLEDLDQNSQDSGYGASSKNSSPKSRVLSFGSCTSNEEEALLDIAELEQFTESPKLPSEFGDLITGWIRESPKTVSNRIPIRRAFSLVDNTQTTPVNARVRCLFKDNSKSFKRPEPLSECFSPNSKRTRTNTTTIKTVAAKSIYRSVSAEECIKTALHRDSVEPDLVGDFSKPFCLPLVPGKHRDLKSISPNTLVKLMNGDYNDHVGSFQVIDCRFPYEFDGGHITGAKNLYTKEQIVEHLINARINKQPEVSQDDKRDILVFHCEFSSERGPNLSRHLRSVDRSHNMDHYPYLHYPEIYLLDGGYKNFYETNSEFCAPEGYLPMLHPDHEQNLRMYRTQSKTFNADSKSKSSRSSSFRRL